jgi:hypothetical protein
MKPLSALAFAAAFGSLLAAFVAAPAVSQQQRDPDWPCIQPKVPELSVASVWSGPPTDAALSHWQEDKEVSDVANKAASRRISVEEATAAITAFAKTLKPDEKAQRLTLLFAGIFETLDRERSDLMNGIDRYARVQKAMAEDIRQGQSRLSDLNSAGGNAQQVSDLSTQLTTQVRIFNDRRSSLTYVCEVPTILEQRLFTLARAIQAEIPS